MPTLPTSTIDLSAGVSFVSQPSRTWYINKETNRIQGECDGWYSVRQAVEVILNVERFRWQIYSPYSGMQWDGLIGQDPGYVASELQRRITGAENGRPGAGDLQLYVCRGRGYVEGLPHREHSIWRDADQCGGHSKLTYPDCTLTTS